MNVSRLSRSLLLTTFGCWTRFHDHHYHLAVATSTLNTSHPLGRHLQVRRKKVYDHGWNGEDNKNNRKRDSHNDAGTILHKKENYIR